MLLRHKMSYMRQGGTRTPVQDEFDPEAGNVIASVAREYPAGFKVLDHFHGTDQLVYAIRGVMQVSSGQSSWFIPPHFALWVPAGTHHEIYMPAAVSMRAVFFRPGVVHGLSPGCSVLHVTPLLRELVLEIVRTGQLRANDKHERALTDLTVQNLERASPVPVFVTSPRDERALAVANAVLANPAQTLSLAELCEAAGVSVRTLQRAFLKEVGSDFESWRRQLRLTRAVELLLDGRTVKEVAFQVGYCQPSAFVESFRRTFGATPKAWTAWLQGLNKRSADKEVQSTAHSD